jgi:hypothetical protein
MEEIVYQDEMEQLATKYERGRILRTVPSDAWEIIKDTVHAYVEDLDNQVRNIQPGDPIVISSQAALYAMDKFESFFVQDLESAMEFSINPSKQFREYLFEVRDKLDVIKHQGE